MFFSSWLRDQFRNRRSNRFTTRRKRPVRSHKLALESLEDRCLLSAGDLDLGFGTNGVATFGPANGTGSLAAIALAPDGKIVAGGLYVAPYSNNANINFALSRFLSDGAVDSSFGDGGWVSTGFGGNSDDRVREVAVLPDGRVLAGGFVAVGMALSGHPPHRSVREELPHTAPPSGSTVEIALYQPLPLATMPCVVRLGVRRK